MRIELFEWDMDTIEHIARHDVSPEEVAEVAFDDAPYVRRGRQGRRYMFGQTVRGRPLFVVYVITGEDRARTITARDMDEKERKLYATRGK